jgi:hypothetical protein
MAVVSSSDLRGEANISVFEVIITGIRKPFWTSSSALSQRLFVTILGNCPSTFDVFEQADIEQPWESIIHGVKPF